MIQGKMPKCLKYALIGFLANIKMGLSSILNSFYINSTSNAENYV